MTNEGPVHVSAASVIHYRNLIMKDFTAINCCSGDKALSGSV